MYLRNVYKKDVIPTLDISSFFHIPNPCNKIILTRMNIDPGIPVLVVVDMGPIFHHNDPMILAADNRIYLNRIKKMLPIRARNEHFIIKI